MSNTNKAIAAHERITQEQREANVQRLTNLAKYAARHLQEDIRKGVDMTIEELYQLLDTLKILTEGNENE